MKIEHIVLDDVRDLHILRNWFESKRPIPGIIELNGFDIDVDLDMVLDDYWITYIMREMC